MARIDEIDYYRLLGVGQDASQDEIQAAFHVFARRYHPDAHRDDPATHARYSAVFRRGTEAYRVLRSVETRKTYDAGLSEGRLRYDGAPTQSTRPPKPLSPVAERLRQLRRRSGR